MKNQQAVSIQADEQGNVVRVSNNNPEFGHVRLIQSKRVIRGGWVNKKERSALLQGTVEDLTACGYEAGEILDGNIIIKESFTPFNKKKPEMHLKVAGDSGVTCKGVDQETGEVRDIYRTTEYDDTGLLKDQLIPHVNGDEIKAALTSESMSKSDLDDVLAKGTKKTKSKETPVKEEEVIEEPAEEEVVMEDETFEL
jgi:hypothetical protein|tara:strand:- start:320 stop:910 length:591 start_codon:yes stop_codon:yes gene_type:complete